MTSFKSIAGNANFVMNTRFPEASYRTIETVADFGLTQTDAINQVIDLHRRASEIRSAGGILLVRSDVQLDPLEIPKLSAVDGDVRDVAVRILPILKDHLEPLSNENDPADLLPFWKSAISFYNDVAERLTLGHELVQVNHDLSGAIFKLSNVGPLE